MRLIFNREAKIEVSEAFQYYENANPGMGRAFVNEVEGTARSLEEWPLRWPKVHGRFRRALISRFPYGIIYTIRGDEILVIAVAHLHRRPGYWRRRT